MLGFSLYPHHLAGGSACTLESFCAMVAETVELMGIDHVGIGSDLCQGQDDSVVEWMRNGKWRRPPDPEEADRAHWPEPLGWFASNRDFGALAAGLAATGFSRDDVAKIMGENWLGFFERSFGASAAG